MKKLIILFLILTQVVIADNRQEVYNVCVDNFTGGISDILDYLDYRMYEYGLSTNEMLSIAYDLYCDAKTNNTSLMNNYFYSVDNRSDENIMFGSLELIRKLEEKNKAIDFFETILNDPNNTDFIRLQAFRQSLPLVSNEDLNNYVLGLIKNDSNIDLRHGILIVCIGNSERIPEKRKILLDSVSDSLRYLIKKSHYHPIEVRLFKKKCCFFVKTCIQCKVK